MEVMRGESACVMGGSGLAKADIAAVLRESVSFGRFVNEPLEWGKWSSFSQNRYIEEAEKYSARGSVAEKKAFFEEHYKKIAAKKKAAEEQLEQEEDAAIACTFTTEDDEKESDDERTNPTDVTSELAVFSDAHVKVSSDGPNGEFHGVGGDDVSKILEPDSVLVHAVEANESVNLMSSFVRCDTNVSKEYACDFGKDRPKEGSHKPEGLEFKEEQAQVEVSKKTDSQNCEKTEMELSKGNQHQKSPLKDNNAFNQQVSSMMDKKIKASETKASILARLNKPSLSSLKPKSPCNPRKENNPSAGLFGKKTVKTFSDRKTSTQNSLHMSIHPSPRQKGSTAVECSVPKTCKASESKLNFGCFKPFQDFSGCCKTPAKDSAKGEPKVVPVTPQSENRNKSTSEKTESSTKRNNAKWNSFLNRGKSSCIGSSSSCSPQVVSTFFFRSEERAERRKEYFMKLEEKLNAEKLERQAKAKEKAENELKLLRQSLGFKARPLPKFYHRNEPPKQDVKKSGPVTKPRSPKLGRAKRSAVCFGQ